MGVQESTGIQLMTAQSNALPRKRRQVDRIASPAPSVAPNAMRSEAASVQKHRRAQMPGGCLYPIGAMPLGYCALSRQQGLRFRPLKKRVGVQKFESLKVARRLPRCANSASDLMGVQESRFYQLDPAALGVQEFHPGISTSHSTAYGAR